MGGEHLANASLGTACTSQPDDRQVREVLSIAEQELDRLLQQRAQLTRRIGTVKQTILGLARLAGKDRIDDHAKQLLRSTRDVRTPGLTDTCRLVLIEAEEPLSAREICARIEKRISTTLSRHKDPMASVTTVLNRLLHYGEVFAVDNADGSRAYRWVSETHGFVVHRPGQSSVLIRPLTVPSGDDILRRCAK